MARREVHEADAVWRVMHPTRRRRGADPARLLAAALATLAALLPAAPVRAAEPDAAPTPLARALDAALAAPALRGARVAALVVDRSDGRVLYGREAERALIPASNLKVLTALGALARFGPAHRFPTTVRAPAAPDGEGAVDWLAVRGGGDPALTSEQWWRLAADLRVRGLRRVRGDLRMDASVFDDERWHASWAPLTARAYHAPVAGLSANYGAFRVQVAPGPEPGAPARVRIDPPLAYFDLVNEVRTGGPDAPARVRAERSPLARRDRVKVTGTLPVGGEPVALWRSVSHPVRYAGAVLRMQLEANGIAVEGDVVRAPAPGDAKELLRFEGHSLATLTRLFVKNSNNMIAEALVKAMALPPQESQKSQQSQDAGRETPPASWRAGLAALRGALAGLGLDVETLRLADGSGLSRSNRVSPRHLVEALRAADASFDFGPELLAALPIAAADGTLEERADGAAGAVRAKTGLLSGVTGLSGFARSDGREVVFSVLANGYRGSDRAAMDALDGFAAALVEHGGVVAAADGGPR